MRKWLLGISLAMLLAVVVGMVRYGEVNSGYQVISDKKYDSLIAKTTEAEFNLELTYDDSVLPCDRENKTFYLPISMGESTFAGRLDAYTEGNRCTLFLGQDLAKLAIDGVRASNQSISLIACNGNQREQYFIKITGMPIASFSSTDDLNAEGLPVFSLSVLDPESDGEYEVVCSATATLHGNTSLAYEKKSLRLKLLQKTEEGYEKAKYSLLGLRRDDDFILNSLYADENRVRDKLAIDLWNELGARSNPFGKSYGTDAKYCEVFINEAYQGLYLMMVPIDAKQLGMEKVSAQISRGDDVIERLYKKKYTAAYQESDFVGELPDANMPDYRGGFYLKGDTILQNEAEWEPLRKLAACIEADDQTFSENICQIVDQQNAVENWLFYQAIGGFDNANKNVYYAYRKLAEEGKGFFVPWDLNISFGCVYADNDYFCEIDPRTVSELVEWAPGNRMVELNCEGSRELAASTWHFWREKELSDASFAKRVDELEKYLKNSGAFAREKERYPEGNCKEDFSLIQSYTLERMAFIDDYLENPSNE